jgi:hypothetical protein
MRTTIDIDDDVLAAAKDLAAAQKSDFRSCQEGIDPTCSAVRA